MIITPEEAKKLCQFIFQISGIHIEPAKTYLLESRLTPLLALNRLASFTELYSCAVKDHSDALKRSIIDAISTNETFFFRDQSPFNLLQQKIIPDILKRRSNSPLTNFPSLRFWSAACSTGQEVYSIAMTMQEMMPGNSRISILGSDISDNVISRASAGIYNDYEIERGLPVHLRSKFFQKIGNGWQVKDELRAMVKFAKINLNKPFPNMGKFDVIFCRNVAIYFCQQDKVALFKKLASSLQPDGTLIIGGSENLSSISSDFISCRHQAGMYYRLKSHAETEQQLEIIKTSVGNQKIKKFNHLPNDKKIHLAVLLPYQNKPNLHSTDKTVEESLPINTEILQTQTTACQIEENNRRESAFNSLVSKLHMGQVKSGGSLLSGIQKDRKNKQPLLDTLKPATIEDENEPTK